MVEFGRCSKKKRKKKEELKPVFIRLITFHKSGPGRFDRRQEEEETFKQSEHHDKDFSEGTLRTLKDKTE